MRFLRLLLSMLCLAVLALPAFSQAPQALPPADSITIGKYRAHPTRIIARQINNGSIRPQATAAIQSTGLTMHKQFKHIPGLLVLDLPNRGIGAATAPSSEARKEILLERIQFLSDSGEFAYVEPDFVLTNRLVPNDSRFSDGSLWGLNNYGQSGGTPGMDADVVNAWTSFTTGSNSVVVAVIDTGVRYTHRDLAANMWVNPDEIPNGVDDDGNGYVDDIHGINAITGSGDPFDDNDHGTHVSGTIGAVANNGYPLVGVNWNVRIMGLKFLSGGGGGFTSDAIDCINYAVDKRVPISNNSWGGGPFDQALFDAIDRARQAGHLFVAAAGNSAQDIDVEFDSPASYPIDNIVAVAAIDRRGHLANFSNYGRRTVHLGAPGVEILSSTAASDESYEYFDGTSMACPHVVGVAALTLAARPSADLNELKERLLISAVASPTPDLRDTTITGGRVSAFNAVSGEADGILEVSITPPNGASILINTNTTVFLRVSDLVPATNAVIQAVMNGAGFTNTPLSFTNNGVRPDAVKDDGIYTGVITTTNIVGELVIALDVRVPDKAAHTSTVKYFVVDRPANDSFSAPKKFAAEGGVIEDNNTLATRQTGEPNHAGNPLVDATLWFFWTPTVSTPVLIDTVGTAFDSVLAVYTGSTLATAKPVASVDDIDGKQNGYVTFNATAGTAYRIAVGGATTNERGQLRLRVIPNGVPDTAAPSVAVNDPLNGSVTITNIITVTGIAFDNLPSPTGVDQVFLKVNNDIARALTDLTTGPDGRVTWSGRAVLQLGVNKLQLQAADFAENSSQPLTVSVSYRPQGPSNDLFNNAAALAGDSGEIVTRNNGASHEHSEPDHAGFQGGHSLWWIFTAPADGVLVLNTAGSLADGAANTPLDTLIGVYLGDRVDALTAAGSNDDATPGSGTSNLRQAVEAGKTYRIAIDGFAGQVGEIKLAYNFRSTTLFTLDVSATEGGTATAPRSLFATNDLVTVTATTDQFHEFVNWQGTLLSLSPAFNFRIDRDTQLQAVFRARQYTDGFESGSLSGLKYVAEGVPWSVQSAQASFGTYAAKSGTVTDGQFSSLVVVTNLRGGAITFDYKVSSEEGYDRLEFRINGALVQNWSGEVGWATFSYVAPAGQTRLEWRYIKDNGGSAGEDTAFIDNLLLPLQPGVDAATPATLSLVGFSGTAAVLRVEGQVNQTYVLQGAEDLRTWRDVSTNVNTGGYYYVEDTGALLRAARYYRAVARPPTP